ncbi:protein SCAI-like isoform X2 [Oscarella lobularis]|uniref:protein SCAI-like isoform X2 n=1 Tax=Oscarella lobularis TaxID=121494 RepID=UPI0033133187
MESSEEADKTVVQEFTYLLEKSKQLFSGIRDLPQFGRKHWPGYFARTFDVYTRLWKFQQKHRKVLDEKFGLKRWQIGELASKIGQLYYQYYMRTCESGYLHESFSFYEAVRTRAYYSDVMREERDDLAVKRLRYYARFIVVCLLLHKDNLMAELIKELRELVEVYVTKFGPSDAEEWYLVLKEVAAFVEANKIVSVMGERSRPICLSHRLASRYETLEAVRSLRVSSERDMVKLQQALVIGLTTKQVKFSELTLDMFRMLECLEREPEPGAIDQDDADESMGSDDGSSKDRSGNPNKYLLYRPSVYQIMTYLSSGIKDLPNNSAMLLYLSGEGITASMDKKGPYQRGGIATKGGNAMKSNQTEHQGVYPEDVLPFTRKPLMVVVDSSNSEAFMSLRSPFGQPLVCLLSPQNIPPTFTDPSVGGLLTLFLHNPLVAFCCVCGVSEVEKSVWTQCRSHVEKFCIEVTELMQAVATDTSYLVLMEDDFLRLFIQRYIFMCYVLSGHKDFQEDGCIPQCVPPLPQEDVLQSHALFGLILDLAGMLNATSLFNTSDK